MKPIHFRDIPGPILIVAAHPDDDVLGSGGLIQKAVKSGKPVYILFLTNGDANTDSVRHFLHLPVKPSSFRTLGNVRHFEAIRAENFLGVPRSHLFFLGFPDSACLRIASSINPNQVFRSPVTLLDRASYPFSFHRNAPYTKAAAITLFREILQKVKPSTIVVHDFPDRNSDHRAARIFLFDALRSTNLKPLVLSYLVHFPHWPPRRGPLVPPAKLNTANVRSLKLTNQERLKSFHAWRLYRSQFHPHGRLNHLININEIFWLG